VYKTVIAFPGATPPPPTRFMVRSSSLVVLVVGIVGYLH
jgi:hypothetical protein